MQSVRLGRLNLRVSRLCLGTMIFGSQLEQDAAFAVMNQADELGIDFLDVADVYPVPATPATWGRSEEIVGAWLKERRHRFVLATKFGNRVGPAANDLGGSRKHVIEACEASLRRLGTDRIDLYYAHHSDLGGNLEETLEALDRLVQDGKVVYWGVSNFEAWELARVLQILERGRLASIAAVQPRYNLLNRPHERDLLPLCQALGLGVMPYNPLGAGMLTGKYARGQEPPAESRFAQGDYGRMYQGRYLQEAMFDVVDAVREVAASEGMTAAQVAVAWLLAQEGVTSPIVGASSPAQLGETVAAVDLQISPAGLEKLDAASRLFR
jgi:aryl-alcohol dehydrogenase-like predicted oxidoreductase